MMREIIKCPQCKGKNVVKRGKRKTKFQEIQRFKCKDCGKSFTKRTLRNRSYPARVIYSALNNYNKGLTLEESSREVNKRFGVKTYPRLISAWLQSFKESCPYLRIRKERGPEDEVFYTKQFWHPQPYLFKYHQVKLRKFLTPYFSSLANYLQKVPRICPDELFLQEENTLRCSQFKLNAPSVETIRKENYACKLADFALRAIRSNKERHDFVENFMLWNDTATLAIEIPVWLLPSELPPELEFVTLEKPLTGHIDLLQARYGILYILDYKPQAKKVNALSQLFLYALALSLRTDIWLRNFHCGWFDEQDYYEFNPNDLVIPKLQNQNALRKYLLDEKARKYYTSKEFHEAYKKERKRRKMEEEELSNG